MSVFKMAAPMDQDLPADLIGKFSSVDDSLTSLENALQPLLSMPRNDLYEKLEPLDRAKMDLMAVYGINSLFWMYLNVSGVNPKTHGVRGELDRIRTYMNRVKEIQDKQKAPRVDKPAAQRFVKSALWQAAHKKPASTATQPSTQPSPQPSTQPSTEPSPSTSQATALTQDDMIPQKRQKFDNKQRKKKHKHKK